jgi:hypothetical protein
MPLNVDKISTGSLSVNGTEITGGLPYKIYTALLTQNGGSDPIPLQTGNLTIGVTYLIYDNSPGMDFTNVGAPNNNVGTSFVATGTTPNSWGTLEGLTDIIEYNTGAPVVTVLENTIGNIWFTYNQFGIYGINSNNLFTDNKTFFLSQITTDNNPSPISIIISVGNTNTIILKTLLNGSGIEDSWLSNTPIEIRVYN